MTKANDQKPVFHYFALAAHGTGISGGDRIWVELARRWSKQFPVQIHTWKEGREMAARQNLLENNDLQFKLYELGPFCDFGFAVCYISRIIKGIQLGLTLKLQNKSNIYLYNASEFWMDALPSILLKMRYPNVKWIATWYQTAPNPFKGFSEKERSGEKYRVRALAYWLIQLPIKPLIKKFADKVIVNNEDEKRQFPEHTKNGNSIAMIGAVPLDGIQIYALRFKNREKKYDAVFQGRFHPQKGVVELIDIWKHVVEKKPNAKLAMIGDGPLMESVSSKIQSAHLQKNVDLFGFVFDGPRKYGIFASSKIVVHPAFYDSGGMATAEAMAFGIPAVGFNLKAYESYYPRGMIKVKNENEFANAILRLLKDDKLRKTLGREAEELIKKNYSWNSRAAEILQEIRKEADTGSSPV